VAPSPWSLGADSHRFSGFPGFEMMRTHCCFRVRMRWFNA
jgi:hypothetical protein